jgi:hypothetical protein
MATRIQLLNAIEKYRARSDRNKALRVKRHRTIKNRMARTSRKRNGKVGLN